VDRGYFNDEGLDVELYQSNDASASAQMLATGQAAFHPSVPDPVLFNAMARGVDVKLLASLTVNGPSDNPAAFLVRSDHFESGRYTGPSDLKGMTVAVPAQSSQFYVERVLSQGGLTLSDVEIVILSLPDIVAAFGSKRIDAAWNVEPLVTAAVRQGLARTTAGTGQLFPGANGGMIAMAPSFGRDNPEAARRFVIAYLRGMRDYYHAFNKKDGDRAQVLESLIAHTPVKDPALYDVMGLPAVDPNGAMNPPSWDAFQDFYIRLGIQQQKVDLSRYVDVSYLDNALDRLGREP
jgi:NitT/TauT family transport system substrate-binding protein